WLYGQLRLWLLVRLTQIFAVTFNLGLVLAFVALSYGNDPTFGWRSTMLEPFHLHQVARTIGAPWSRWEAGIPTLEQVQQTQYSQLEQEAFGREQMSVWAAWWPFLLASLLVYGLLPRLLTLLIADRQVRHALRHARLEHHEVHKLCERLQRPLVETQALTAEEPQAEAAQAGRRLREGALQLEGQPLVVLQWAGVRLGRAELEQVLQRGWGARVGQLYPVGRLEADTDRPALEALATDRPAGVLILVEAWEPPVAEYQDLCRQVRERVGEGVLIVVLLYHQDPEARPVAPRDEDLAIWQNCLANLGDPWLAVRPLMKDAAADTPPVPGGAA
ncbi:MAG: DUF2868 domain-containing protein, partial [Planctomycetales bacterium]|nr:DUF2868 domain-containing protein [Planctomycetales bacterium]